VKAVQYLVLGGGPSGLSVALALLDRGVPRDQVVVLEKEDSPGGLCRSEIVDGAPLDIGGGHFLDVRRSSVLAFLFRFLPEAEWTRHRRISRIRIGEKLVDYPLEANLWQLAPEAQVDYLEAIARAGCVRGDTMPAEFEAWVTWKLGERIARDYMLPYNRKLWSGAFASLGTSWLHKLPDVSFRDTLQSCLERRPTGTIPAHGVFLYPGRHGFGEVWRRMGAALKECLVTGTQVESVDVQRLIVNGAWKADRIVSTIPWTAWPGLSAMPDDTRRAVARLRHVAIDVDYVATTLDEPSHWIYEPDEALAHHRKLLRSNFIPGARGYWTETNSARSGAAVGWRHRNEFAYPVATRETAGAVATVLRWAEAHRIRGIGRWGKWEHLNMDVAVAEAMDAADDLRCREGAA
jgi:protoporphyrinogen oxidase